MKNRPKEIKGWIVWAIMAKGSSVMRAIVTDKALADLYSEALKGEKWVERSYIEETKINHLYLGYLSHEAGLLVTTPTRPLSGFAARPAPSDAKDAGKEKTQ